MTFLKKRRKFFLPLTNASRPTVCVDLRVGGRGQCLGAEKTRSQPVLVIFQGKMLLNRADSHTSGARFVGTLFV
jgi:hypothetical protein